MADSWASKTLLHVWPEICVVLVSCLCILRIVGFQIVRDPLCSKRAFRGVAAWLHALKRRQGRSKRLSYRSTSTQKRSVRACSFLL